MGTTKMVRFLNKTEKKTPLMILPSRNVECTCASSPVSSWKEFSAFCYRDSLHV